MSKASLTLGQRGLSIALLIAGAVTTALAVPPGQVLKSSNVTTFRGPCCFSFDETVGVTEPAKPVPVVVTWSGITGLTFEDVFVGLMVNGGPCRFYGAGSIPEPNDGDENTHTFLWIVFPSDGLSGGNNTFTLCGGGGGVLGDQAVFSVLDNTLTVRLSN